MQYFHVNLKSTRRCPKIVIILRSSFIVVHVQKKRDADTTVNKFIETVFTKTTSKQNKIEHQLCQTKMENGHTSNSLCSLIFIYFNNNKKRHQQNYPLICTTKKHTKWQAPHSTQTDRPTQRTASAVKNINSIAYERWTCWCGGSVWHVVIM